MQEDEAQTSESQTSLIPQKGLFSYFTGFKETLQQSIQTAQKTVTQQIENLDQQVSNYIERVIQPENEQLASEQDQYLPQKVNFDVNSQLPVDNNDAKKLKLSGQSSKSYPEISQSVTDSDVLIQKNKKAHEDQKAANRLAKQQYFQSEQYQESNNKLLQQLYNLNKSQIISKFVALKNEYVWVKRQLKEAQQQIELQSETDQVQKGQLGLLKAQLQRNEHLEESENQMFNQIQRLMNEKQILESENHDLQRSNQILQEMVDHIDHGEDASTSNLQNPEGSQSASRLIDRHLSIDDLSLQVLEYLQDLDATNQRSKSTSLQNFRTSLDRLSKSHTTTPQQQMYPRQLYDDAMNSAFYSASGKKNSRNLLQSFDENKENLRGIQLSDSHLNDQPLQYEASEQPSEAMTSGFQSHDSPKFQDAQQAEDTFAQIQNFIKNSVDRSRSARYSKQ